MTNLKKIIIAYIPVLHQGYFQFLTQHKDAQELWLLDDEIMEQFSFYKKDIRRLEPDLVKKALSNWKFDFKQLKTTKKKLKSLTPDTTVVLPNDEISYVLEETYLHPKKIPVIFEPVFLRWSKHIVKKQQPVSSDHQVTTDKLAREMMGRAFAVAAKSTNWWRHVGAVIARGNQPVITAWNHHLPSEYTHFIGGDIRSLFSSGAEIELASSIHAEAEAIAQAARRGIKLEGSDIYATTFPCAVCAKQIAAAGIKRLFFAAGYSLIDGQDVLKAAGVEIIQVKLSPEELRQMQASDLRRHIIRP